MDLKEYWRAWQRRLHEGLTMNLQNGSDHPHGKKRDIREVSSGLGMLGLLLSEEAGKGNNVSADLFALVLLIVAVGRHGD